MSNFSTAYDALRGRIAVLFPSKQVLINPYSVESNGDGFLHNGQGVTVLDADAGESEYHNTVDLQNFGVVFTIEVKGQETDPDPWITASKSLQSDHITLRTDILNGDFIQNSDAIDAITYLGTSPVSLVGDTRKHLQMIATYSFRITESLK